MILDDPGGRRPRGPVRFGAGLRSGAIVDPAGISTRLKRSLKS